MIASRRLRHNLALEVAVARSRQAGVPLLIFEPLRADYPHASTRFHRFVIDGMIDNRAACQEAGVTYLPHVERRAGDAKGLLAALAREAVEVVTDDPPFFHYPSMLAAAAAQLDCPLTCVDGDGLVPARSAPRTFLRAVDFRRYLQKTLPQHLRQMPVADPLAAITGPLAAIPRSVQHWGDAHDLLDDPSRLTFTDGVGVAPVRGGSTAALAALHRFLERGLDGYADGRNHPDDDQSSHLSAWLHFGHIGAHEVFDAVVAREPWSVEALVGPTRGQRVGWWGLSEGPEAFLDQLVTWRELGRNRCALSADHAEYDSLPDWARATLADHADDRREWLYSLDELEQARTHEPLWNAAQNQLVQEGRIHNYLRMLWGKCILAWSPTPREAAERMVLLNDRYALDGRDPNSYAGIFWVLGRYDRPWGPERPVFGKVRYMSPDNTRRKLRVRQYLARWS